MEKSELNYVVKLVRVDGTTIDLVETKDFSKAKGVWLKGHTQWTDAVADRRPFLIEEPADNGYITAFDPSLIHEILILPVELEAKSDNPYKQRMRNQGLSSMVVGGVEGLMDGGYK